jgi:predicted ester cyclase
MSTEDNKALVRRFLEEVWNKGNVAVVDELMAPNHVDHFDFPAHIATPAEYQLSCVLTKQFVPRFRSVFPDLHFTVEFQVAEEDMVVTRATVRGTYTGEYRGRVFQGSPPTGQEVTWTQTLINRIADGKIVESWDNEDQLGWLQQIGALPTAGQTS